MLWQIVRSLLSLLLNPAADKDVSWTVYDGKYHVAGAQNQIEITNCSDKITVNKYSESRNSSAAFTVFLRMLKVKFILCCILHRMRRNISDLQQHTKWILSSSQMVCWLIVMLFRTPLV